MKETNQKYKGNYNEAYRPQFHFSPQKNWMNDPNGLVYFEGEYHLFYQYNPIENKWGHMSWGHAISNDLIHWQHLPVALFEENDIMIFSGCVVVDKENNSGLSDSNNTPLVAVYTGHNTKNGNQSQCLAYSTDKGRNWTKFKDNPVLDISSASFRDPKVFWYEPFSKWIMLVALSDERKVHFYSSDNLKDWDFLSEFGPVGAVDGVWECPDIFQLAVDGDSSHIKWVFKIDLASGAKYGGSGGQYFIGNFDGTGFQMDDPPKQDKNIINWIDAGNDFYAAASFSNLNNNRCIWMGWLANWLYAENIPTGPWKNICSIPRELALKSSSEGIRLIQKPVKEYKRLRKSGQSFKDILLNETRPLTENLNDSGLLEIEAEFEWQDDTVEEFGFEFFFNKKQKTIVGFSCNNKELFINRTASCKTDFNSNFPRTHFSLIPEKSKRLKLVILLDKCSIEIFANNGEVVFTELIFPETGNYLHNLYIKNGPVMIKNLSIWQLDSIWEQNKF